TDDINGKQRPSTSPTVGAFEASCAGPLSGIYTIDNSLPTSGTNYQSFSEAVQDLADCGISAPVIFNIAPGQTFTEQVDIPEIVGASPTNTITFNGNGSTLTHAGTSTSSAHTLRLDGADYFIFDSLQFVNTGATYAFGTQLVDNANHN